MVLVFSDTDFFFDFGNCCDINPHEKLRMVMVNIMRLCNLHLVELINIIIILEIENLSKEWPEEFGTRFFLF